MHLILVIEYRGVYVMGSRLWMIVLMEDSTSWGTGGVLLIKHFSFATCCMLHANLMEHNGKRDLCQISGEGKKKGDQTDIQQWSVLKAQSLNKCSAVRILNC